ncbi:MAG: hypothetical protein KatS3mg055_2902 [Chloroflexus sp.]|nr:MAG: hypothetical protein KatS3mg055_2902 [Chloroflexus sp.]
MACRGTACRAPTMLGDPPGRPDDGRRARWATRAMGDAVRRRPTRTGTAGWVWHVGARHAVPRPCWATRRVAPTMGDARDGRRTRWATHAMGDAHDGQPDAMGDAPRCPDANRYGMWGYGMPYPDHVGRPIGSPQRNGRRTQWAANAMGDARDGRRDGRPDAMGDAPRRPDANRHGMMGMACRGTACRAPTMLGDPAGRPDDGHPDAMGDAVCRPGAMGDAVRHPGAMGDAVRHPDAMGDAVRYPDAMGDAVRRPDAMGDAVRCPDANRHGMMGMACRGTACRAPTMLGDPAGRPYDGRRTRWVTPTRWAANAMGDARDGQPDAMGDAVRCPDANRHGMMGMACRGTACRAPTMLGDPAGRPYGGQPDAMGDAPRRPDANRYGSGGTACRGTALPCPYGWVALCGKVSVNRLPLPRPAL